MSYVTRSGSEFRLDGQKFRFIGVNCFPLFVSTESSTQIDTLMRTASETGVTVIRTWCFDGGYLPSNTNGNFRYLSGGVLNWREEGFIQLDRILDTAQKYGLKLILSLSDDPTYNTKNTYIRWSDSLYGTSYFSPTALSSPSLTREGVTVTCTTSSAHGLRVRNIVNVAGANEAGFNGRVVVTSVPTATTFTYISGTNGNATATGTITASKEVDTQAFFDDANCRQMFKDFISKLINRRNTINGRLYRDDETIFAWELGNELRYALDGDPQQNSSNSNNIAKMEDWADVMSTYIKSLDPNHLVSFGSMAHTYTFTTGDTISNGSYYGVDYRTMSALENIDYLDFHIYPNQNDNDTLQKYGQRLGYANEITRYGLIAQLRDFIKAGHENDKPVVCGENGYVKETTASNAYVPFYPRHSMFKWIMDVLFDAGLDGFIAWHWYTNNDSYNIVPGGYDETDPSNANYDDSKIRSILKQRSRQINGKRIFADDIKGISI